MSEPNLISPLLDGFSMGNPMSDHDGVRCCPAIKENSDKKYIVKIISVPATQKQMDALLLAGAYKDPADAMDYFKDVGEGIMKEAELLKKLSKLEGFLSYEGWQMEPITRHRLGYEVYLVGSYKRSLDKYVRRNPVTHLEAVNLGLDLCAALSVCRQAGALYVDLKPSNIFMSENKDYRIGDLGFIELDALSYTSLPTKYRSQYTAPELFDPMATINMTADTYAVGMILYQLYNEGYLPFKDQAPDEPLPTPVNADYELAEIIMKAIHPNPEERWQDPKEMGQALVSYMQRNTVNDIPITPYIPLDVEPEPVEPEVPVEAAPQEPETEAEVPEEEIIQDEQPEEPVTFAEEAPVEEIPEEVNDETLPGEEDADALQPHEMSEELAKIMDKADDLIAHEAPVGVIIPEIPEEPDPFRFATEDNEELLDLETPLDPIMEETPEEDSKKKKKTREPRFDTPKRKQRTKRLITGMVLLLILAGLAAGGYWYYQNMYLQTVNSLSVDGTQNELVVTVDAGVDPSLLTVVCSDNYGNVFTQSLTEGKAVFTKLLPNTMYKVQLEVDGFHKLIGQTSDIFTTDATTEIVSFTAVTGPVDGSVQLNFTVDGDEPPDWKVIYYTEGEEEQFEVFSGHSVIIQNLSVGKVYTFVLDAGDALSLSGTSTLEYRASRIVLAEDLTVTSNGNGDMTVHWKAPGDIVVSSWTVRCYNGYGYEEQLTVNNTEVYLTGIDHTYSHTVEVTAEGMTQAARTSITANPISISQMHVDETDPYELKLNWEYTGNAPEGGWILMYRIDGSSVSNVIRCDKPEAVITPRIPGAKYQFTIQSADGISIFNNVHTYTCPAAEKFEKHSLSADNVTALLLMTPEKADWRYESVGSDAFTTEFTVGAKISVVLRSSTAFYTPSAELNILYVIRDVHGNVLPDLISEDHTYWKQIWLGGDTKNGELNLPTAPATAGEYVLHIYFDGMSVAEVPFTVIN